ncbi:PQQ-binding-like beta-propeller repeat protein, partial [Actinoplanes sp. NPDC051633]|uniref:outer membrane protein assembly factor BamB family protein n=1 Tax=Actinoplanes sp. NPDC051633 TaxID=3155670 RepID=UPI003446C1F1
PPGGPAPPAAGESLFRRGVAEAATPTPTPATVPQQPPAPTHENPAQAYQPPAPEQPPAPDYADPVDPWATGEAAAFGPGGSPPYNGPGHTMAGHTAAQPAHEPWLASTQAARPESGPEPGQPTPTRPAYRRKGFLIVAGGLVVVLLLAGVAAWYFWPGYRSLDYQPLVESKAVSLEPAVQLYASGYMQARVNGDRAYFATENQDKTLGVVAADTSTGKRIWGNTKAGAAENGWEQIVTTPDAFVAYSKQNSDPYNRRMVVLDADDGNVRWQRDVAQNDRVLVFDDVAVWVDDAGSRLVGLRMSDGSEKWNLPDVKNGTGSGTGLIWASTPADVSGPAQMNGRPLAAAGDDTRMLQVMSDRSARVIDRENGKVLVEPKPGVAAPETPVILHNGRVVVAEKGTNSQRILSYDLTDLSGPAVIGSINPEVQVEVLAPCGDDHACWIEKASYDAETTQIAGADVSTGAASIWHVKAPNAETLVPVGDNVLVGQNASSAPKVTLLDSAGKEQFTADGQGARLDGGNVLLFSKALSTSLDDPALAGQHVGDDPVQLGPLAGVHSASCSWNTEVIACVTDKDLRLQRFAS